MQPADAKEFLAALATVMEVTGGRPPSEAGGALWFRALDTFSKPDVLRALQEWAERNSRPPTIDALRSKLWNEASDKREALAEAQRAEEAAAVHTMARTPQGLAALKAMRKALPPNSPQAIREKSIKNFHRILDEYAQGVPKSPSVVAMAQQGLKNLGVMRDDGVRYTITVGPDDTPPKDAAT